jgi:DNA-binding response OmpR family regulator
LELLHEVLTDAGFETTDADSGSAALTMVAKQRFDVLLVDVNLPDMSGMIVCDAARERYQERITILVITGSNIERRGVSSLQVCADDFLGKPFDPNELIARIESKLRRAPES